jgi:hypothetical protein
MRMAVAARSDARWNESVPEPDQELAAWREEIRRHALAQLARKAAKPPRPVRIGVLVALLVLLAATLIGLRQGMRLQMPVRETAIEIRLIDESQPELPPQPVPAPLPSKIIPRVLTARPMESRHPALPKSEPETGASALDYRVFNADGSVLLPPEPSHQGMQASFIPQSTAASPIMVHQRPLKVRPNHFAQEWQAPAGETLLGAFVREHLTADTQFMTPWGTLMKCGVIVLVAGCTWGPPPVWQPTQTWRPATALDEE